MNESRSIRIGDESGVGAARREAAVVARALGLDEQAAGRLAIVVNELGKNVWQHARGGEILLRALDDGVEVLALDKGPGISDVGRALGDGYSTRGTAGTGLGAVRRLSYAFDIYTIVGAGSALMARVGAAAATPSALEIGGVCVALAGETVSGDQWSAHPSSAPHLTARTVLLVADGLGHGPDAAAAARAAIKALPALAARTPKEILEAAHDDLRATRGAACFVVAIDRARGELTFAGVGNVFGQIVRADGGTTGLPSSYGTLGADPPKPRDQTVAFAPGELVILATDGVRPKWHWPQLPALTTRDPALVAGVLYRDYASGRDDATVVAARQGTA